MNGSNRKIGRLAAGLLAGSLLLSGITAEASNKPLCDTLEVAAPAASQSSAASSDEPGYAAGYRDGYRAGLKAAQSPGPEDSTAGAGSTAASATGTYREQASGNNGSSRKSFHSQASSYTPDTLPRQRRFIHAIGAEFRPEYICPTNQFLRGNNNAQRQIGLSLSAHLRYSFRARPGSLPERIYGGVYQGLGVSYYSFGNREQLGNPVAFYLFQGARIARINPRLSFNYEWNFGVSFGWKPYNAKTNKVNVMMGSKVNAYLNANFYFDYMLSRHLELTAGLSMSHFSNGNTQAPNAGMNSIGMKLGLLYNFGPVDCPPMRVRRPLLAPDFPRHMSYDLTLFGSWRRKAVEIEGKNYATPDTFGVAGFNFAAMYNFGYKFRAGASLDGVYDGSANVYTKDYIVGMGESDPGHTFYTPPLIEQLALGVSARAEFVMPYFTVGVGLGVNVLHRGGDLKAFYQMLTLKIAATRNTFVHVGYCLKDFQTPNYLMLGVGFRFNNKYPRLR